jgi:hypothetical protein
VRSIIGNGEKDTEREFEHVCSGGVDKIGVNIIGAQETKKKKKKNKTLRNKISNIIAYR